MSEQEIKQLVRDLEKAAKFGKSNIKELFGKLQVAIKDCLQLLYEQKFHMTLVQLYHQYKNDQSQLLDILYELAKDKNDKNLELLGINGGIVDLFQYFMISTITPQRKAGKDGLQTKSYGAIQSLAPISTNSLLKLDKWIKIVIRLIRNNQVKKYISNNQQDIVDYVLLVICKSDTMLKQMSIEQKASSKLLIVQTKLEMMDYLYILSEFDWCKDKINSEADYFEAIYEDIYEHVQTISNLSKIYLLLSNLMISQTYIDRENFMRKSLITVTEYLVFPQLIEKDEQMHSLIKQAIDQNYTRFDLALAKCYFSISQNVKVLKQLLDELQCRQSDILARFLIFLCDRGNITGIIYLSTCLYELILSQGYKLDPMKEYHLAYSIQNAVKLDKRVFIVLYRFIKFLTPDNQKLLSFCCYAMQNKEIEPIIDRPYDDYDLIQAFQEPVNPEPKALYYSQMDQQNNHVQGIILDQSQIRKEEQLQQLSQLKSDGGMVNQSELKSISKGITQHIQDMNIQDDDLNLQGTLLQQDISVISNLEQGIRRQNLNEDKSKFNFELKKHYPTLIDPPYFNANNDVFTFSRHCKFACAYCTLFYSTLYQAPFQIFINCLIDQQTLELKEIPQFEIFCSIIQAHFDQLIMGIFPNFDYLFTNINEYDSKEQAAIFLLVTQGLTLQNEQFNQFIQKADVFVCYNVLFGVFWKSFGLGIAQFQPQFQSTQKVLLSQHSEQSAKSINLVLDNVNVGKIYKLIWDLYNQTFQFQDLRLSGSELQNYLRSQSDQVYSGHYTLYFMKLHLLYHAFQSIGKVMTQDIEFNTKKLGDVLNNIIMVLNFFSEMVQRVVPVDPFLLESQCWDDCRDMMKEILDSSTRTIDTILYKTKDIVELLDQQQIIVKLINTLPNLPSLKSIMAVIQIIDQFYIEKKNNASFKEHDLIALQSLVQILTIQNNTMISEFQDFLKLNRKFSVKFEIFNEKSCYKLLNYIFSSTSIINSFFLSQYLIPNDMDSIQQVFPEESLTRFLQTYQYFIELNASIQIRFTRAKMNEKELKKNQKRTLIKLLKIIPQFTKSFILMMNFLTQIPDYQILLYKGNALQTILATFSFIPLDTDAIFLLMESLYNSIVLSKDYQKIKDVYPKINKDFSLLFNKANLDSKCILPLIRAIKLLLINNPSDAPDFYELVPQIRERVFRMDKYQQEEIRQFEKKIEQLELSVIQNNTNLNFQQTLLNPLDDPTFVQDNLTQTQVRSMAQIPFEQLDPKQQQMYVDKMIELEGKQLLKLINLTKDLEIQKGEKEIHYKSLRKQLIPYAGTASYQMIDSIQQEMNSLDSKKQQAKIQNGGINRYNNQLLKHKNYLEQRNDPIPLTNMQKFLLPGVHLSAPSMEFKVDEFYHPNVPEYFKHSPFEMYDQMKYQEKTLDMEEVVNKNKESYEMSKFIQQFPKGKSEYQRKGLTEKIDKQDLVGSDKIQKAGQLTLQQDRSFSNSISQMPNMENNSKELFGNEISMIERNNNVNSSVIQMQKEFKLLKPYNFGDEVNEAYKRLMEKH